MSQENREGPGSERGASEERKGRDGRATTLHVTLSELTRRRIRKNYEERFMSDLPEAIHTQFCNIKVRLPTLHTLQKIIPYHGHGRILKDCINGACQVMKYHGFDEKYPTPTDVQRKRNPLGLAYPEVMALADTFEALTTEYDVGSVKGGVAGVLRAAREPLMQELDEIIERSVRSLNRQGWNIGFNRNEARSYLPLFKTNTPDTWVAYAIARRKTATICIDSLDQTLEQLARRPLYYAEFANGTTSFFQLSAYGVEHLTPAEFMGRVEEE